MPHLHVALVSERPEISLIPLLQLRPQRVLLIVPEHRLSLAERLRILLTHELPDTGDIRIRGDLPPAREPARVSAFAGELATALRREQAEDPDLTITYDLAGTSRLSALLIQHALHRCRADWLHVDVAAGALYRLGPELNPASLAASAIEPLLDADLFLLANGRKRIKARSDGRSWRAAAEGRRPLTRYLAHHADHCGELLAELAGVAQCGAGELARTPAFPDTELLRQLDAAGVIAWSGDAPRAVAVPTPGGADYLSGAWLAEQAWLEACDAGLEAHCLAHVLDLSGRHNEAPAVFGCLVVHRNQLLVVACLTPGADDDGQAQHALHALVEHTEGMAATRALLSARPLGRLRDSARRLAIPVREGAELKRLAVDLRQWREGGRWPET
ncbi:DUF1887 family protein [Billgrantia azerbaijanica]|nr:DUF1887 family protein [Halomonas azerbaijanica]